MSSPSFVTAVVLGTAQDGGLPQAGCRCVRCADARAYPERRRRAACLALIDAGAADGTGAAFLIDATPDIREQVDALLDEPALAARGVDRRAPIDGVLLTHAHVGHHAGLLQLGREVMATRDLPVHATERMTRYLSENAPWSQLVDLGHVRLETVEPGVRVDLTERLAVTPWAVPHRQELSDTVAYLVEGPTRSLLWLPDIDSWDSWDAWERSLEDVLREVDVAFLDGTFRSADELPGRDIAEIPHPLVPTTVERFEAAGPGRAETWLVHLNHSNALLGPDPEPARELAARGLGIASEGQRVEL